MINIKVRAETTTYPINTFDCRSCPSYRRHVTSFLRYPALPHLPLLGAPKKKRSALWVCVVVERHHGELFNLDDAVPATYGYLCANLGENLFIALLIVTYCPSKIKQHCNIFFAYSCICWPVNFHDEVQNHALQYSCHSSI